MSNSIQVTVPDIGDFKDVEVIEVLVSGGDTVEVEDALVSHPAVVEAAAVAAPQRGTRRRLVTVPTHTEVAT